MTRSGQCYAPVTTKVREKESSTEIPSDGHGSTKALHITTKVKNCTLPKKIGRAHV